MTSRAIILPWLGEFGWLILRHARYVQWHPARDKIVCCESDHKCLFPSASHYICDWQNPIPENERWEGTRWGDRGARDRYYAELRLRFEREFPGDEVVAPTYECHWHTSDAPGYTFYPQARTCLPRVDVVLGARNRAFDATRNWAHWQRLAARLQSQGLTVGVVGRRETSYNVVADTYAWEHPDGDTAGSVDLLSRCALYLGVDSGLSHLAALMQTPMLVLQSPPQQPIDMTELMQRANKTWIEILPRAHWDDYEAVEVRVLRAVASRPAHYDLAVSATLDATRDDWLGWLEAFCTRIENESHRSGRRIARHVVVHAATDEAIAQAHRYRNRVNALVCIRHGHRRLDVPWRPVGADCVIALNPDEDPQRLQFDCITN